MATNNFKKGLLKGLKKVKKAERSLEKAARKALTDEKSESKSCKPPQEEYVHPWREQDLGQPTIVDQMRKEHCCGCASCMNACPKNAISMEEDSEGFRYPQVDHEACISCGICIKKCPAYCEQPDNRAVDTCYATIAENDTDRLLSSSGGLFTQIADYAFERGGVVFGAAYESPDTVCHRVVESRDGLDALRRSKYVQSYTGYTYSEVKDYLNEGKFVLYSGCHCQIAGVYAFLGKDYDNLLTVDLICHGTPSPGLFRRYLEEDYAKGSVKEVNFRDKSAFGWSTHMNVYLENGDIKREFCGKDPYYLMFLRCLAMRPFCSICKYTKLPRVADLSIGDWWGVEKYNSELNDHKGTSLLLVNNEKGEVVFEALKHSFRKIEEYPLSYAQPRNYTIDKPFKAHPARKRFFKMLEYQSFDKSVRYALNYHYDVGIFGLWYGENYGSMLTYYGLQNVIESMGLSSVFIENPIGSDRGYSLEPHRFARRQDYNVTRRRSLGQMNELNEICDSFLLGSDQLWNPGLSRPYGFAYFLSFVNEKNKRIAYGTSFGKDTHVIDDTYRTRSAFELSKFDAISVRDDFSKQLLKNNYGNIESTKVLDPALLCNPNEYWKLAEQADPLRFVGETEFDSNSHKYLFVYILDPNQDTMNSLEQISKATEKDIVLALDYSPKARANRLSMFEGSDERGIHILDVPSCEQWLCAIRDSEGVLTDSFHGTIFAYVFEKPFVCYPNAKRGNKRFSDLLNVLNLEDRALSELTGNEIASCNLLDKEMDYAHSKELWEAAREKSYKWLRNALFDPKQVVTDRVYSYNEVQSS